HYTLCTLPLLLPPVSPPIPPLSTLFPYPTLFRSLRRRLVHYALLPNYRAYWKEAGYVEEMAAVEQTIADNRAAEIPKYLTDRLRSEEHTSELQSRGDLVCRHLLENKKKTRHVEAT